MMRALFSDSSAIWRANSAVVPPVGKLCFKDEVVQLSGGTVGAITQKLYDTLTGIQTGKIKDEFGWVRFVA